MPVLEMLGTIVVASLGLLLWGRAVRTLRLRAAMKRWPVEEASIENHRTRRRIRSVAVDVLVSFRHAGREHRVWCVSPTRSSYGAESADQGLRQEQEQFPRGATAPVYVNPVRPEEAYLKLPEQHMIVALFGFGAMLIALSIALSAPAWKLTSQEVATLGFFLVVGVFLSVFVISAGAALFRLYFPKRRPKSGPA